MCGVGWGGVARNSQCMLLGWWLHLWDLLGSPRVSWNCWSSYRVTLLFSFFQFFPNHRGYQFLSICWVKIPASDSFICLLDLSEGSHDRLLFVSTQELVVVSPTRKHTTADMTPPIYTQQSAAWFGLSQRICT